MWILQPDPNTSFITKLINLDTLEEVKLNIIPLVTDYLPNIAQHETFKYRYEVMDAKQRVILVKAQYSVVKRHKHHFQEFNFLVRVTNQFELEVVVQLTKWLWQSNLHTPNFIIFATSERAQVTIIDRRTWKIKNLFIKTLEKGYVFNTLWQDKDELRVLIQHSGLQGEWDGDYQFRHAFKQFDLVVYSLPRLMHENFTPIAESTEKFSRNDFFNQLLHVNSLPSMEGNTFRLSFRGIDHLYLATNNVKESHCWDESYTDIIQTTNKLVCAIYCNKDKQKYLCRMNRNTMDIESKVPHRRLKEQEHFLLYKDETDNLILQDALTNEILAQTKKLDIFCSSTVGILF